MNIRIRHALFAVGVISLMSVAGWLLVGEFSPLHSYFLSAPNIPNLWRLVNMPMYVLAAWIGGNAHHPPLLLLVMCFIVQWGIVGIVVSWALFKLQGIREGQ